MIYLQSAYYVTTKCLLHTYKVPTMYLQSAYYEPTKCLLPPREVAIYVSNIYTILPTPV